MRPPKYGIDDAAEYVDLGDESWDIEKVGEERKQMEAAEEDPSDHPVTVYLLGESRYSLDVEGVVLGETKTARQYLKKDATIWMLNRLSRRQYRSYQTLCRQDNLELANEEAVRLGLEEVRGPQAVKLVGGKGIPLTDEDLDRIWESNPMILDRLARAIVIYSQPLTAAEGKL